MGIVLTFVFNSVLNLVLGLAVAAVLGPAEYGRFAIAFMFAIVLGTALFDWLRYATTRFIVAGEGGSSATKSSIEGGYGLLALGLVTCALFAQLAGVLSESTGVPALLVAVTAVANARFEFRAAEARAQFLNGAYIRLVLIKNVLALFLMLGAGLLFHSADWVLAMTAVSSVASSLLVGRRLDADFAAPLRQPDRALLISFARYGLPIVGANLVYQIIVLANRGFGAKAFGLADAGSLSLATDLTIRLLLSVGAALDAYLFQIAVRRRSDEGEGAAKRQVGDNMLIVGGVLGVLAVGYAATLPALESLFVPSAYRGSFSELSLILLPGIFLFCFAQFGLNPIFQLSRSTAPLLWSACVALIVDLAFLAVLPPTSGIAGIIAVHSVALAIGALVVAIWAAKTKGCWPSLRETLKTVFVVLAVACAMWPFRTITAPWFSLAGACVAGGTVSVALLMALDIMGGREHLLRRLLKDRDARRLTASPIGE